MLQKKLMLESHERDLVLMQHDFEIEWEDKTRSSLKSSMMLFGSEDGTTAMARTVGLTAAVAAEITLEGRLKHIPGVLTPTMPEFYLPGLDKLAAEGLIFEDSGCERAMAALHAYEK